MKNKWNTTSDVDWMLLNLSTNLSERKRKLIALGFCRRIENLISKSRCGEMINQAKLLSVFSLGSGEIPQETFLIGLLNDIENNADGMAPVNDIIELAEFAELIGNYTKEFYYACYSESWGNFNNGLIGTCDAAVALYEASRNVPDLTKVATYAAYAVYRDDGGSEQQVRSKEEEHSQCNLIRDIIPGEKLALINPSWLTSTVLALANGIYSEKAFDRMPILGDALQDAGCDNEDILNHCRQAGEHVRGCWVIDLLLSKQ